LEEIPEQEEQIVETIPEEVPETNPTLNSTPDTSNQTLSTPQDNNSEESETPVEEFFTEYEAEAPDDIKQLKKNEVRNVLLKVKNKQRIKDKLKKGYESRSNDLVFAEIDGEELSHLINDSDVISIWPDLETQSFLNVSVPLTHADVLWDIGLNGNNVKVAILDTGIAGDHEMLTGKVVSQMDFTGSGDGDVYGHGTHVAGIVAGEGLYDGVASGVQIYSGKVLNDFGGGQLSWLINGIDWAIEQGVDIISLSLGATYDITPEEQLSSPEILKVEEAISQGITVVIAAGNCGTGCSGFTGVTTPGISLNALTVGAVDNNLDHASFSSGGTVASTVKPDLVAPGVGICSSIPSGYQCKSGTSMATPFVTGGVALLLQDDSSLSPAQVKQKLEESANDLGDTGKDVLYGSGFIDLSAALGIEPESEPVESYYDIYPCWLAVLFFTKIVVGYCYCSFLCWLE